MDLILAYRDEAQHIASVLLALAMWRWGAGPERALAFVFMCFLTLPVLAFQLAGESSFIFSAAGGFYAGLDLVATAAFIAIALNANRNYPLWIAGFQIVAASAHLLRGVVDTITPIAYAIMAIAPSYFQLVIMGVGLWRHYKRKERFGEYRDWRIPASAMSFGNLGKGKG